MSNIVVANLLAHHIVSLKLLQINQVYHWRYNCKKANVTTVSSHYLGRNYLQNILKCQAAGFGLLDQWSMGMKGVEHKGLEVSLETEN